MNILICDPIGRRGIVFLEQKGYRVSVMADITAQELMKRIGDVDAVLVRGRTRIDVALLDAAKRLKVVGKCGSGTDNIDVPAAKKNTVIVVNAPGATAESVAEHAFSLILGLSRSLISAAQSMREGKWMKSDYRGVELMGKTLGIVGYGSIGRRVAEFGKAFGMNLLIYSRTPVPDEKNVPLVELLEQSDVVSVHVPLTDDTRNLIGSKEFMKMKKTAFFVNTSRGAVVDEHALVDAIKTQTIAGAGLDVYATEPLPMEHPIRTLPTVLLTPHVAAVSPEGQERASFLVATDVDRVLQHMEPLHPVR